MKTTYRLTSSQWVHGPGIVAGLKARHRIIPDEDLNRLPARARDAYNASFYQTIYLLGSTYPSMQFGHVVAIIEDKATITYDDAGETAVIVIEEPDHE
jgi:hypothetical protein